MDNQTTPTQTAPVQAPAVNEHAVPSHEAATYNPQTPAPQMINGVKVFPTSYIPAKAELHTPKKMMAELQDWHIEGIHIVIFFILIIVLFIGMWKRPNLR